MSTDRQDPHQIRVRTRTGDDAARRGAQLQPVSRAMITGLLKPDGVGETGARTQLQPGRVDPTAGQAGKLGYLRRIPDPDDRGGPRLD